MPIRIELDNGDILVANKIQWMDSSNEVRAAFSISSTSGPNLLFFDKNGQTRLVLGIEQDMRAGVHLYSSNGQPVLSIVAGDDPICAVSLRDDEGKRGIELSVSKDGRRECNILSESDIPIRLSVRNISHSARQPISSDPPPAKTKSAKRRK
ncbi:hypothetical protein K2Y11_05370 [bacterium]|nr:hypothetical protein [bacterium]